MMEGITRGMQIGDKRGHVGLTGELLRYKERKKLRGRVAEREVGRVWR